MIRRKRGEKKKRERRREERRRERCEDFMIRYQKIEGEEIKPKDLIESRIMYLEMMMKVGEKEREREREERSSVLLEMFYRLYFVLCLWETFSLFSRIHSPKVWIDE